MQLTRILRKRKMRKESNARTQRLTVQRICRVPNTRVTRTSDYQKHLQHLLGYLLKELLMKSAVRLDLEESWFRWGRVPEQPASADSWFWFHRFRLA